MSRGLLVACPSCDGKYVEGRTCRRCDGLGVVPDSPAGEADPGIDPAHLGLPAPGAHELFLARINLKEAATNYAATLLMSRASADIVNVAFKRLEQAAEELTRVKERR